MFSSDSMHRVELLLRVPKNGSSILLQIHNKHVPEALHDMGNTFKKEWKRLEMDPKLRPIASSLSAIGDFHRIRITTNSSISRQFERSLEIWNAEDVMDEMGGLASDEINVILVIG